MSVCDYESAVEDVKKQDSTLWIDVQGFEKEILEKKLDDLEIIGMAKRLCLDAHDRQGFYPMKISV